MTEKKINDDYKIVITEIRKDIGRIETILKMNMAEQKTTFARFQEDVEKKIDDHEDRIRANEKALANYKGYIFGGIALAGLAVAIINILFRVFV